VVETSTRGKSTLDVIENHLSSGNRPIDPLSFSAESRKTGKNGAFLVDRARAHDQNSGEICQKLGCGKKKTQRAEGCWGVFFLGFLGSDGRERREREKG